MKTTYPFEFDMLKQGHVKNMLGRVFKQDEQDVHTAASWAP